ncbi:hypothetical protein HELRODRAFT_74724, partial [Helobdella robusta]|uniref:VASt domain-containing protein n=1 Tax=Helobdella robusta TaxID=6412 RepID=T1G1U8_HELRO
SYKSRSEDFKRIFKALPADERLIVDYSCALQKDILIQGRMYLSQSWICFYANIFRWETVIIRCKDITKLTKEKTARVIPNAIQICTKDDKYFFASFGSRDKVFLQLDLVRRNASNGLLMSKPEFWSWVHFYYGDDLALTSDDEDYVPLTSDDKNRFQLYLQMEMGQDQGIEIGKALDLSAAASTATTTTTSSNRSPTCNGIVNSTTLNDDVESFNDDDGGCSADVVKDDEEEEEEGDADYRECEGSEDEESSSGDDLVDYCSKHSHFSIDVLDEAYDLTVDDVFQHVFSDSQIYREFIKTKKTFDVSLNPWSEELDEKGRKVRNISYTLTLDFSIGPKHSPSTEKQVMHTESEPGRFYLIDCECVNEGIPYGENFFITNRYCLSRLSDKRSRLKITSQINYKKNVWGFIKSMPHVILYKNDEDDDIYNVVVVVVVAAADDDDDDDFDDDRDKL